MSLLLQNFENAQFIRGNNKNSSIGATDLLLMTELLHTHIRTMEMFNENIGGEFVIV